MSTDAVTVWLHQLKAGESAAARPLWEKYFHRLVGLARTRLRSAAGRVSDVEDVALSAFDSFCRYAAAGRFPDLTNCDSLWRLLAEFTLRKAAHHVRDGAAFKRGGGNVTAAGDGVFEDVLGRDPDAATAKADKERLAFELVLRAETNGDLAGAVRWRAERAKYQRELAPPPKAVAR